jgi:hypothetical protein
LLTYSSSDSSRIIGVVGRLDGRDVFRSLSAMLLDTRVLPDLFDELSLNER